MPPAVRNLGSRDGRTSSVCGRWAGERRGVGALSQGRISRAKALFGWERCSWHCSFDSGRDRIELLGKLVNLVPEFADLQNEGSTVSGIAIRNHC